MMRSWLLEVKYEFLKLLRLPVYSVFTLVFPLMFYVFFGLVMGQTLAHKGPPMAAYLVATYGTFGVMGVALFSFGTGLAVERGLGWLELRRASPMPMAGYLAAKCAVSMLFCLVLIAALFTLATAFGGVRVPAGGWFAYAAVLVAGSLPFCVLGLGIGYLAHANSAPVLVNCLYLPMAFCSGLWIPIQVLPGAMQSAAPFLPPYHLAQIALAALGLPSKGSAAGHAAVLAAFTVAFAGLAWFGQARERARM